MLLLGIRVPMAALRSWQGLTSNSGSALLVTVTRPCRTSTGFLDAGQRTPLGAVAPSSKCRTGVKRHIESILGALENAGIQFIDSVGVELLPIEIGLKSEAETKR
jgi:hypothetical protein